jgi:hypothetical protein
MSFPSKSLRAVTIAFALFGAILTSAHANTMPPVSGVISIATEPVTIKTTSVEGKVINRTVGVGQPVYLNDEIKTGPGNKLQILLKDQTVFNVGPNSVMTIDKFVFDPSKGELSVGIQKGAFKFVSGKVSNSNPDAMKVKLPNATISVRGTGVAGNVAPDGASTVVLLHGVVDVAGAAGTSTLSKSGWGVQVAPGGVVGQPTVIPPEITKGIMGSVAQIKAGATGAAVATAGTENSSLAANVSNSGLTAAELANSVDASQFVSAATAQSFKNALLNSLNTQAALNGNPDTIPASVLTEAIRSNPAVWAGILVSMGMPADTPVPDATKQSTLSQYINSDFARYYALLVFPKMYNASDIINRTMGPLGTLTFSTSGIPMSCATAPNCGTNPSAMINSHTVVMNYSAAQVSNTYNVSYSNFNGASGTISGSATSPFSSLQLGNINLPANAQQNVQLPLSNSSGPGSTGLAMVGQFGSIGNLVGKFSTMTTVLSQFNGGAVGVMRAGYQVKGQ